MYKKFALASLAVVSTLCASETTMNDISVDQLAQEVRTVTLASCIVNTGESNSQAWHAIIQEIHDVLTKISAYSPEDIEAAIDDLIACARRIIVLKRECPEIQALLNVFFSPEMMTLQQEGQPEAQEA
ncbi:MAG: hypothetical protein AB7R69_00680 [Candidatus Babeliales bacterium]